MGARLFEFNIVTGNEHEIVYVPTQPDEGGKLQKPFSFTIVDLPRPIGRVEFIWGMQASIQMRRKKGL